MSSAMIRHERPDLVAVCNSKLHHQYTCLIISQNILIHRIVQKLISMLVLIFSHNTIVPEILKKNMSSLSHEGVEIGIKKKNQFWKVTNLKFNSLWWPYMSQTF